ncbi:MAG: BBP7 family outer membrane beta-barrel protein [Thermoguttaceae bacterium]|jgi:hypothetical protein
MSFKALAVIPCLFLVLAVSSAIAFANDDSAALRLFSSDAENNEPIPPGTAVLQPENVESGPEYSGCCDLGCCQSCCCPQWTATADAMILDRIGNKSQTILGPREGETADRLDSNDFAFGFAAGPRLSLIRQTQCYDYEVLYFGIDGWSDIRFIPQSLNPASPLLFDWSSRLYNVELNMRWNPSCRLTMLAGFRWANLREDFIAERVLDDSLFLPVGNVRTNNNLYGFQVGADARLWQCGCFSINGLGKAGIYGNHAEQSSFEPEGPSEEPESFSASTNHTAFIGKLGLQARYQVTQRLALRAGYELLLLDGVAIAPVQIGNPIGIDSNATVFYHGATAGLELSF